jgi:hypothetical protein
LTNSRGSGARTSNNARSSFLVSISFFFCFFVEIVTIKIESYAQADTVARSIIPERMCRIPVIWVVEWGGSGPHTHTQREAYTG